MFTKLFLLATAERALKTFAQAAISLLVLSQTGLLGVDFVQLASVAGLAAVVSVLTSIVSNGVGQSGPSLTTEAIPPAQPVVED